MKIHRSGKILNFTLIELLITVSVIAILISVMLPALNKAKTAAGKSSCIGNQRQLLTALMLYMDSNNGYGCPANFGDNYVLDGGKFYFWLDGILYGGYAGKFGYKPQSWGLAAVSSSYKRLTLCPALAKNPESTVQKGYGMFFVKPGTEFADTFCYNTGLTDPQNFSTSAYFLPKLKMASELGYIGCSGRVRENMHGDQYPVISQASTTSWNKCSEGAETAVYYGAFAFCHNGTGNMGMADGSVRSWNRAGYEAKLNPNAGIGYKQLFRLFPFNWNKFSQ